MRTTCLLLLSIIALANPVLSADSDDPVIRQIELQRSTLREQGITKFFQTAKSSGWTAPIARSQWWADRSKIELEKARFASAKQLGLELLSQITTLAATRAEPPPASELHAQANALFEFADWCAQGGGYANALLARRAFDLALVPASRLVVDPATTPELLGELVVRLSPAWLSASYRAKLLDDELEASIFGIVKTDADLIDIWQNGSRQYLVRQNPDLEKSLLGVLPAGSLRQPGRLAVAIPASDLPFFADDPIPAKPTTLPLMNGKHHELIVNGFDSQKAMGLRSLIVFRRSIGALPTVAAPNAFPPGMEGTYEAAWLTYAKANPKAEGADNPKLGLVAWFAVESITNGNFRSDDEQRAGR